MAKFEKGNKKGYKTLFTSDNQPVNRGRKPKLYTIWKSHATLTLLATQDCPLWLQYD